MTSNLTCKINKQKKEGGDILAKEPGADYNKNNLYRGTVIKKNLSKPKFPKKHKKEMSKQK